MEGAFDHRTKQLLSQERILDWSAPAPAPGSGSSLGACLHYKANTRFPLQTWLSSPYLISKEMHLLQREKASCGLCCQLFLWLPFSGPSPIFSCCVSSIAIRVCILKCTVHYYTPQTMRHVSDSAHWGSSISWESSLHCFCTCHYSLISTVGYLMHRYTQYKTRPFTFKELTD